MEDGEMHNMMKLEPQFNDPYLSTSLQDFWGRRWNLMVTSILRPIAYEPIVTTCKNVIGLKWAQGIAILGTFAVSALMHELIFYHLGRVKPTWEITWFFLLHGVCLTVEIALKKAVKGRWQFPRSMQTILTIGFVVATGFWLFFPPFVVCKAVDRAIEEYAAVRVYLKKAGPKMGGDLINFLLIWVSAVALLCYCHKIGQLIHRGTARVLAILPVVCIFLVMPLGILTLSPRAITSFFLSWLANFKLLLFVFDQGPLSSNPPLSLPHTPSQKISSKGLKSHLNYALKFFLLVMIGYIYTKEDYFHPKIILFLYVIHIYIGLELILAMFGVLARACLGVELEPQFDEPYLASSLQDFWGKRWNLMVTSILHPTVYSPIRSAFSRWIGKKWASLPAVIGTFLVSGLMHELIFYHIGRQKPKWEVTCFFLLHGFCLAIEMVIKREIKGTWGLPRVVAAPTVVGFVVVTAMWLFMPTVIRSKIDAEARMEAIALINCVEGVYIYLKDVFMNHKL
ncbi:hypothetical protein SADUNF_Sadunf16G0018100 [Salix dunnii]|uniref:Wax synthase domain-containing protein n=1 Tax=Salix dunnii TaxID=1413687 RepID=A0A835MFR5_9ROSI|nr:hypothetical protein SADUNF_Sadunf16G0018100 [Salix dunnii]